MRFSFSAIASPFLFFTRFFSSFLQAYIFPVARTWQAQTWRKQATEETWWHEQTPFDARLMEAVMCQAADFSTQRDLSQDINSAALTNC